MAKKNFILSFLLLSLTFASMCQLAFAQEHGTPQIGTMQDIKGRVQYAKELQSFLKKIDDSIPTLSPSQREWLEKELGEYEKSGNTRRYLEIFQAKEYKIKTVKNHLGSMVSTLNSIIKKPPLKDEAYFWSLIAEELMDVELWSILNILIDEFSLVDSKLFVGRYVKNDQCFFYHSNGILPASQIIRNVIQPYLEK